MFISPAQNGPLYYPLLRPWLHLVGSSEFVLRYTSVLFGTLTIALFWQTACRLLPGDGQLDLGNTPLVATLLLTFNPYQVWYSQEGKMYALVMCLALLSSWSWLEAMRLGGAKRWLRYLLVTTISIYTHLMTALLLPLHFVWFLAWPLNRLRWQGHATAVVGFILPYIPLIWWQWHYLTTLDYQTGYAFTPFPEVLRVLLLDHTRGAFVGSEHIWLVPVFFLGLAGLLVGYLEMGWRVQSPDAVERPGSTTGQPFSAASHHCYLVDLTRASHPWHQPAQAYFRRSLCDLDRSAFVMLLALGVQVVWHSGGRTATMLAALLTVYLLTFGGGSGGKQTHTPNKTQLRQAITYVAERREPDELLILQIPHTHYAYRYYTSDFGADPFTDSDVRLDPWVEGLWTHNDLPG